MNTFFQKLASKIVKWLDPKLAKYRTPEKKTPYTPRTQKEFIAVLKRTPEDILSGTQRNLIASVMSFDQIPVSLVMVERKDMMFLSEADFLGPLLLDKMFKTGNTHFPVLDKDGEVSGIVNTEKIDPLKITEDQPLDQFIDKNVFFARADYSLQMLLTMFLRTDSSFCLVVDKAGHVVGSTDLDTVLAVLFNHHLRDTFDADNSAYAVARRDQR